MKKRRFLVQMSLSCCLAMLAGSVLLSGQTQTPTVKSEQQKADERSFSIKVNVDLVVLNLTVVDEKGTNVTRLKRDDFSVFEDEV